jgi:5-methylcytosine-specific restriction protein A
MLSELFDNFAKEYPLLIKNKFKMDVNTDILRHEIPTQLTKLVAIPSEYKIYGSVGQGQWAEIPWVAILDKNITGTTQNGYYVVFLFSRDMKEVFLSLAVGWTQYEQAYGIKEGRDALELTVKKLQDTLRSPLDDFSFSKRSLGATKTLGKGYESGGICHKTYKLENMPPDEIIISDVNKILGVYRELRGYVGTNVLNLEIDDMQIVEEQFKKDVIKASDKIVTPGEAIKEIKKLTETIKKAPATEKIRMAKYVARNRKFAELIKKSANYTCQICGMKPFKTKSGGLYAEAHHELELAIHKIDHPDVMICLCAQCHRIITYGTEEELEKRKQLKTFSS